ncbi:hypothetical protein AVEN_103584-1 [Araneus ventricosus]|uniref:THAP-type domain-containing protein n=1 Tax=Araneus ventricosus TaxID=182803 RepID=A0A4Y2TDA2_ARAVE|nr:hypothetical protein AVEN_103584-1 [Araneus ventricosus]
MDTTADTAYPKIRFRNGLRTCSVCEIPGRVLFRIPPDENRYKKWFSALKWNLPPEKLKYMLVNAKVCDRHFSDACFTGPLKERLIKFACPHITEDLLSKTNDNLSALPSPVSVEVSDTEPSCSALLVSSPTASTFDTSGRLQVLSHSVATALNLFILAHKIEENAKDTMNFVKNMDILFDTVNSRTLKHQKKELRAVSKNSCHEEIWKKMVSWTNTWQIHSSKGKKFSAPCKNGWILTLNAFIGICQELLKKNKFVLTNRFNQDVVENTFSSERRRGGFRDNPDAYEFRHTIHKVIITNFLKQLIGKNCQDDDAYAFIDFSSFNKNELFDIIDSGDCVEESVQDDVAA